MHLGVPEVAPRKNFTCVTATSSVAVATKVTGEVLDTFALSAGEVIVKIGGLMSVATGGL